MGKRKIALITGRLAQRLEDERWTWRDLIKGLLDCGLRGVRLVISDDHQSTKQTVQIELPNAE